MKTYKVTVDELGTIRWYNDKNQLHRIDGPAVEYKNGNKLWCINGLCHREDGPACEWADGNKEWFINGRLHREDGPAIIMNGNKYYYLNDIEYTERKWKEEVAKLKKPSQEEINKALEVLGRATGYKITKI